MKTQEQFLNDIPLSVAVAAHNGTSWTPDTRGEQDRKSYAEQMAADYANLLPLAKDESLKAILETEFERFREGYRKRYLAYLHSSSRCVSSFIAGPSNFPARRMNKRADIAHKRLNEFIEYRTKALAAIRRDLQPWLKPVMAGDSDAVSRLEEKISAAEKLQEQMKAVNAAHKAFLKNPASLETSVLPDSWKEKIRNYKPEYSWEPHPIAPYELTNNSANIRRMKERLESISRNKATEATEQEGENARLEDCPAENRVRLFFPGKPDEAIRSRLKASGFRWTPTLGCWQAYRNYQAIETAKKEAGLNEPIAA